MIEAKLWSTITASELWAKRINFNLAKVYKLLYINLQLPSINTDNVEHKMKHSGYNLDETSVKL